MNIPNVYKVLIEVKHIGQNNWASEVIKKYVLAYDKEGVRRRITPVMKAQERNSVQLSISEIHQGAPLDFISDEVIDSILNVNGPKWMKDKQDREWRERNPGKYSKPRNVSLL